MLIETNFLDSGRTKLLTDMFRERKKFFVDKLGWDLSVTKQGQEIDEYDPRPGTTYLIQTDNQGKITASCRIRPLVPPIMSKDLFGFDIEPDPNGVEVSRFCGRDVKAMIQAGKIWSEKNGYEYILGVFYPQMLPIYKRAGWEPVVMDTREDQNGKELHLGIWR